MEEAGPPPEGEAKEEGGAVKAPAGKGQKRSRRPSDLFLPIAIIGRLMKEPLPDEMKVTKRDNKKRKVITQYSKMAMMKLIGWWLKSISTRSIRRNTRIRKKSRN